MMELTNEQIRNLMPLYYKIWDKVVLMGQADELTEIEKATLDFLGIDISEIIPKPNPAADRLSRRLTESDASKVIPVSWEQ